MKIIFAYNSWSERAKEYHEGVVEIGQENGLDIVPFTLTPNAPRPRYSWKKLNRLWKRRNISLVSMFYKLKKVCKDADVLWVYNGANFHPGWLKKLPSKLLKVYSCFDDPESSHNLSAPVAPYFDACLVGNIASIPQYQGWGCKNVEWGPIFLDYIPDKLKSSDFKPESRPIDLVFFGERESSWRRERLDYLAEHFPHAHFYGRGWANGYVDREEMVKIYKSAKIGINIHNSTGPINKRLFELPAYGVMQICDNKSRLGQIFNLGEEVVGYDNITEAEELIKYYLENDKEREEIARKGHERLLKDYTPDVLWRRNVKLFEKWKKEKDEGTLSKPLVYRGDIVERLKEFKKKASKIKKFAVDFWKTEIKNPNNSNYKEYYQTSVTNSEKLPYKENPEYGPSNLEIKKERIKEGGFFEWPNIVAQNWAVASMVGDAKTIVEIGSGTGCFAFEASTDPTRQILCLEADEGARLWASKNRKRPNITYEDKRMEDIDEVFDLLVSVDVIEHIGDYRSFLSECKRISKRAIFTTPNRFRNNSSELNPAYVHHVREWSAGEFYWMLKGFWDKVELYSRPDPNIPLCVPVDINAKMNDLIAVCYDE